MSEDKNYNIITVVSLISQCAAPEKNPYLPHGRSFEIPRGGGGGGVLEVKNLEAKCEAKLEFTRGGGCKTKNLPWGKYGYFLEHNDGIAVVFQLSQSGCWDRKKEVNIHPH